MVFMQHNEITIITSYSDDDGPVYDAALVLPEDMNVTAEHREYRIWYNHVYCSVSDVPYHNFIEHLLAKGARAATGEEVEVFEQ